MLRALFCRLGFHRYEWFTVSNDDGAGRLLTEVFACRLCCDRKVSLVHMERTPYPITRRTDDVPGGGL